MPDFVYITEEYKVNKYIIRQFEVGIKIAQEGTMATIQFVDNPNPINVPSSIVSPFDPEKSGDQFTHKVCNRCNRLLPVDEFQKNQNGKNNRTVRRPSCNDCRDIIDGKNIPVKIKHAWNNTKPHMVIWECPICKKRTIPGLTSKVVLDHNHSTGHPNDWICDSCNTGLGRFNDDISVMKKAIKYLKNIETKNSLGYPRLFFICAQCGNYSVYLDNLSFDNSTYSWDISQPIYLRLFK